MRKIDLMQFKNSFKHYTELRQQELRSNMLYFNNGILLRNSQDSIIGANARVFKNGAWGLSANTDLTNVNMTDMIKKATAHAEFLAGKSGKEAFDLPTNIGVNNNLYTAKKTPMSIKEQIEFCKELDGYIASKYPDLQARNVALQSATMEKNLITSDGAISHYEIPRSFLIFVMTLMNGNEPVSLYDVVGGYGQVQDLFSKPEESFELIDKMYTHLRAKKEAVWAESGIHDVVMDAKLAGILSHEAVGHTTEADIVLNGSVAGDLLEQKVASELVTMVDAAHHYKGELLPQPIFVDDEGTEAKDAVLIEKGILKGFMHSRETAKKFGVEPTGNARAYNFSDEPLVRMRNTMIVPGTSKLDDMIADVENGYYLISPSNGEADSTSEFMFGVTLGYEIKNGKLGKAIKDTTISGVAFELLKTITDLSDDLTWISSGMCGKKQPMPVGMGGPAISCKVMIGGK